MSAYLVSIKQQFEYYKKIGERAMSQVDDKKLFWKFNEESNSMATIVKHLHGNMMSRWTEFLTSDGEKEWRERDGEFENDLRSREEMLIKWEEGWQCLFDSLDELKEEDLVKEIKIRNATQSAMDAINRQLAHYPYHIGQMVFIGKMIQNENWNSLSIPKGQSKTFNKDKFSKPIEKETYVSK